MFGYSCRLGTSPTSLYSRSKKRSSSLQRQELLQIIQANMEKNNLCFKTSRLATFTTVFIMVTIRFWESIDVCYMVISFYYQGLVYFSLQCPCIGGGEGVGEGGHQLILPFFVRLAVDDKDGGTYWDSSSM